MRKIAAVTLEDRPKRQRIRIMRWVVIALFLVLSPVFYEASLLCYASWKGLFGVYPHVQTPLLDILSGGYETASFDLKRMFSGVFRQSPWKSSYVIMFAAFWTGCLAMLLRKG